MVDNLTRPSQDPERIDLILERAERIADQSNKLQELVRQLQAENRKLRRLTHLQPAVRLVRKAHEAALKLAALHLAGFRTGRVSAYTVGGISERSYYLARALCELAGVYAAGQFVSKDPPLIEHNLSAAAHSAENDFQLLWRRLPPSRRPKL